MAQFNMSGGIIRNGRATNYGPSDQFNSDWNTGTCKCWTSANYNKNRPCFDYITSPSHIAAVNTDGMDYTATCGTCLAVSCINGPTRGFSWSQYSYPSCKSGGPVVFVQVTDSCPCGQNGSNAKWCCNTTGTITRHIDLSSPAFSVIADPNAGVIDVLFQEVPCPDASTLQSQTGSGAVWATWEKYAGMTIPAFTSGRIEKGDVLSKVESVECDGVKSQALEAPAPSLPPDLTERRTGELPIVSGPYRLQGSADATGHNFTA